MTNMKRAETPMKEILVRSRRYLLPTAIMAAAALALIVGPVALADTTPQTHRDYSYGLGATADAASIAKSGDLKATIGNILKAVLGFVGTLFLVLMVYAGFLYMTARGDSKKVDTAKQLIVGAIIGIVIIAGAYAITGFVLTAVAPGGGSGSGSGSGEVVGAGGNCEGGKKCAAGLTCETVDVQVCAGDTNIACTATPPSNDPVCPEPDQRCLSGTGEKCQ